ncbi:ribosomal-processing cysteine protease Prp [Anaeromicrobium sediminis]|nr:ribosomal-processing cysteine protease Prp [Anaeromicrobium sediminis]
MKRSLKVAIVFFIIISSVIVGCAQSDSKSQDAKQFSNAEIVLSELPAYNGEQYEGVIVKVYVNNENVIYGYEIEGSTGYYKYGEDIVAAGISTIGQNTLNSIKIFTEDKVEEKIDVEYLKCILPNMKNNDGSQEANVLLNSAVLGLYSIQVSYGSEFINVVKVKE